MYKKGMPAYNCVHTALQPSEQLPRSTLHIVRLPSNTPQIFSFKQKRERDDVAVKPSNKRLSRAFLMGSKGTWRNGATTVKLHKLNPRAVKTKRDGDTRAFPLFLENNEQILQSDYSVTLAGPALNSVLDRRRSYLPSN